MHKAFKKMLAAMLAVLVTVSALAGCSDEDSSSEAVTAASAPTASAPDTESKAEPDTSSQAEDTVPTESNDKVTASSVRFASGGRYTTTVKSSEVDLSGLSAANVEVTYIGYNGDEELLISDESSSSESGTAGKYADCERFTKLDEVKDNGDGSFDITFTDENVSLYKPEQYCVRFKELDETASVSVESEEVTYTTDVTSVNQNTTEIKVTVTLDNAEFADEVTEKMISLGCAFGKLNVGSLSSAGKNLTVQLTGDILLYGDEGGYNYGTIKIDPEAVKDCPAPLNVMIDIQTEYAGFDPATLKFADGKISAELKSYGAADLDKLTKDDLKIAGVTVESVEKKDDNTAAVTMSAKDAADVNGFVKLVSGKEADFGGYKTAVDLAQASFYPVFDYCEADGSDLKLTLKLYAFSGTFDEGISADAVSFGGGLEDAKTVELKRESDTAAELVLTVPANGQKDNSFSLSGDVILAAGAMVSKWGEKTSDPCTYSRVYSNETMGKASAQGAGLSPKALEQIQTWVRGKETWYGAALYNINLGVSAFSAVKQVLELTGVLKSDHQQVMDELKQIQQTLADMQNTVEDISKDTKETKKAIYSSAVELYERDAFELNDALIGYKSVITLAGKALEAEGVTLAEDATPAETIEYQHRIYEYVDSKLKENKRDARFSNFDKYYDTITRTFSSIAGNYLSGTSSNNPLLNYDRMYCSLYNFDTQAYLPRVAVREILRSRLIEAMTIIASRFELDGTETDAELPDDYRKFKGYFDTALKTMESMEVEGISPDEVYFDKREIEVDLTGAPTYIGDIKVYATKPGGGAKSRLEQDGYTVINYDLNKGAGGYDIYLGYKTTTDYSKAIKNMIIRTGKGSNQDTFKHSDGLNYKICPYDGESKFKNEKGALNCDAGGTWLRLYYTTEETESREAYTMIYVNNNKTGSVSGKDLNDDSGGDDIYLHGLKMPKPADPSYIKDVTVFKADSPDKLPAGYTASAAVNLNSGNRGEQIYLAYSYTTKSGEAIRSFIIDTETDGAEELDIDGVTYKLCKGQGFDGNLNSGNDGIPMWLYSTTGGSNAPVTSIDIDSIGTGDIVGRTNLNAGAGGDVLYLHVTNYDPSAKITIKKTVGDDPAYYPFCYALGSKVRILRASQDKSWYIQAQPKPAWFTWAALPCNARNWRNTEINEFLFRLNGRTLEQDLRSAGIKLNAEMLVTDIKIDYGTWTEYNTKYWVVSKKQAAYIHKNQSTLTPKTEIDTDFWNPITWAYLQPV